MIQEQKIFVPVSVEDELPISGKTVFAFDEKGFKRNAFYIAEDNIHICEYEEDIDLPDFLTEDERGNFYYKVGWYEELENSGQFDFIIYQRKIVSWLKEETKICLTKEELKDFVYEFQSFYVDNPQMNKEDCFNHVINSLNIK